MNSYRQLRYPIPQCFAFMSILIISFCIYGIYYSKSHIYVPYYLLVTTAIELFFILLPFICMCYKPYYKNKLMWTIYFILTVVNSYIMLYSLFNLYFLAALYRNVDLYFYWLIGIISMSLGFLLDTIANIILINVRKFKYHLIGLLIRLLGAFVYIIYILLYIFVPHGIDNRSTFIDLIFITIGVHVIVVYLFFMYGDYTYSLKKGEVPE